MIRFDRTGVELLGSVGLEWGTLGLGAVALLIASPTARKGARDLLVTVLAGGMRVAQGISDFGGQVRQSMTNGADGHQQDYHEPEPPAPMPEPAH